MSAKKRDAARVKYTLRDFDLGDWRWPVPEDRRLRMKRRITVGVPEEMREAVEKARTATGLSMSEIGRRCFRANVMKEVKP